MVITVKNFGTNITKAYRLGEIDSRMPFLTDQVPADNTTAFSAGQVLTYDPANNIYVLASANAALTNAVVCIDAKATTETRANVLITGIVCVETTTVLIERDACKIAAAGKIAKWVIASDDLNIQYPLIFLKQANKISEGLGKAVTNATTTDPGNKVLVWLNSPLGRAGNASA